MYVSVKGGTNAGRRRPPKTPAREWYCACTVHDTSDEQGTAVVWRLRPGYLVRCPDCGAERPSSVASFGEAERSSRSAPPVY